MFGNYLVKRFDDKKIIEIFDKSKKTGEKFIIENLPPESIELGKIPEIHSAIGLCLPDKLNNKIFMEMEEDTYFLKSAIIEVLVVESGISDLFEATKVRFSINRGNLVSPYDLLQIENFDSKFEIDQFYSKLFATMKDLLLKNLGSNYVDDILLKHTEDTFELLESTVN